MARLLPGDIGLIPLHVGVRTGTEAEFRQALGVAEERVAQLAELGVDLVALLGAPPTMILGYQGEAELLHGLEAKYGKPLVTSARAQAEACHALGIRRLVGITYFPEELNRKFTQYFQGAGLEVAAMLSYPVPFTEAGRVTPLELYSFAKRAFLEAGDADGIYIQGGGWRVLPIVAMLERDLDTSLVISPTAEIRAILRQLRVRQTIRGRGKLLEQL